MDFNLNTLVKKSHYLQTLVGFTLAAAIFSFALYTPDFLIEKTNHSHTELKHGIHESLAHELTHISLSILLALVSFLCFRSFVVQRKFFSALETLPHAILIFKSNGALLTANRLGRQICQNFLLKRNFKYDDFIAFLCSLNKTESQNLKLEDFSILSAFEEQKPLFQDIIHAQDGRVYILQCQETRAHEKIILMTDSTKLHQFNFEARTLLSAVDISPSAYALAYVEGNDLDIFYTNKAYHLLLNDKLPYISSHSLRKILSLNEWQTAIGKLENLQSFSAEMMYQNQTQKIKYLSCQILPFIQSKRIVALICINDRTEEKLKDSQIQQSARLETMGHLAGGIAHDFNNILSIIQGYLKLSIKETTNEEARQNYASHIQKALHRGSSLTKQLLSFGRNQVTSTGQTFLREHIQDMEGFLTTLIHSSAQLRFSYPTHEDFILNCPPDVFTQIIMNLAVNARDAMPQGGEIVIHAEAIAQNDERLPPVLKNKNLTFMRIDVSDTGTGIKAEDLTYIFDPFFTTKETGKGTGLGLSLVYRHVQALGGHIDVVSVLGEGTNFSVYFPIVQNENTQSTLPKTQHISEQIDLKDKIVLLAEDEPDLRYLLKETLEEFGCVVFEASDGAEALSKQDALEYVDFLITDVMMPTMNGLRLAEIMQDLHPNCRIIFISGYPKGGDLAPVKIPEHSLFLTKPIEEDVLKKIMMQSSSVSKTENLSTWQIQKQGEKYDTKIPNA